MARIQGSEHTSRHITITSTVCHDLSANALNLLELATFCNAEQLPRLHRPRRGSIHRRRWAVFSGSGSARRASARPERQRGALQSSLQPVSLRRWSAATALGRPVRGRGRDVQSIGARTLAVGMEGKRGVLRECACARLGDASSRWPRSSRSTGATFRPQRTGSNVGPDCDDLRVSGARGRQGRDLLTSRIPDSADLARPSKEEAGAGQG